MLSGVAALVVLGPTAHAQAISHQVHIAPGSLDAALLALAAQTHDQLLYAPGLVTGRRASALEGTYSTEAALDRLLADTDIVVERTGPSAFALKRRSRTAAPASGAKPAAGAAGPFVVGGSLSAVAAGEPASTPDRVATVAEVQVTGTHIRGAGAGASPIQVMDRTDFERLGQITLAGALSQLPQNFGGQDTEVSAVTFSDNRGVNSAFGTGVNLRGLGANATLVLVDGRRVGGSGSKGDFTDVSSLPSIAVERVEVLLDGASAIYGSDAVGGVVNVLLRRAFTGVETRIEGGGAPAGEPIEAQASAIFGRAWADGGAVFAYEAYHRTALQSEDRAFAASSDLRPLGGSDFSTPFAHPGTIVAGGTTFAIPAGQTGAGLTPASFHAGTVNLGNSHAGASILPDQERQSGYLSAHQALGPRVELIGEALYSFRRGRVGMTYPTASFAVTPADPFFVSPIGGTSETVEYQFAGDLPAPITRSTAQTLSAAAGLRADLPRGWRAEGFLDFAQSREAAKTTGQVNSTLLAEALGNVPDRPTTAYSPARDGFFNPFTGVVANTPAVLAAIGSGFSVNRRRDRVYTASLQADGPLLDLPGGPLKLAVGAQARYETFLRGGTNYISTVAPVPQTGLDAHRGVSGLFAELHAPLIGPQNARPGAERLEVSAAVRWEHYSDFGDTTNPKVGVLWSPKRDLDLRATYGTSFRAPGLRELGDPSVNTSIRLGAGAAQVVALLLTGGNPHLRPETADAWTAGLDWKPVRLPGLRLSASWFDVRYRNRIDTPVISALGSALTDPAYAPFVRRLNPANAADLAAITALLADPATLATTFPATSFGAILDGRNVNTGALRVEGLDLNVAYAFDVGAGHAAVGFTGSDLLTYAQQLTPTSTVISRDGVAGFPARFRGRWTFDWSRGPLGLGAAVNRTSAFRTASGAHVDGFTTADLQLRLTGESGWLQGAALALNVRNLFDTAPPFYNNPLGFGFDPANADVVGRFVAVSLTKRW